MDIRSEAKSILLSKMNQGIRTQLVDLTLLRISQPFALPSEDLSHQDAMVAQDRQQRTVT
jgi:hypothetical protein